MSLQATTTDTSTDDEFASNVPKNPKERNQTPPSRTQTKQKNLLRVSAGWGNRAILALIMSQHPE